MAQQTAVEWLVEQFEKNGYLGIQRIEQAKQMEKEQIINAYDNNKMGRVNYGEQYYNETYGSKGSDETKTN